VPSTGAFETPVHASIEARDRAAVQTWGNLTVPYLADLDEVRLVSLVVRKRDGAVVPATNLTLEDPRESGTFDQVMASSLRLKHFTVPSFEAGDTLDYEFAITRRVAAVPGQYWCHHTFFRSAIVGSETVDIDAPADLAVTVKTREGQGIEATVDPPKDGRRHWHWTHRQAAPEVPSAADIARFERDAQRGKALPTPDIQLSSFRDWPAVSRWYAQVIASRALVDEAIRTKAAALVQGKQTDRERLAAIHRFVAQQVRYVSLAFGVGRFEPRPAPAVLSTQYGDCKDKHTLLAALASAVGLTVRPVLIASARDIDPDVPSPAQFDHVITLAEPLGDAPRWMDATSPLLPAGALVRPLRGKRGLVVVDAARQEPFAQTPRELPFESRHDVSVSGTLDTAGLLAVTVRVEMRGDLEAGARLLLSLLSDADLRKALEKGLTDDGLETGTLTAARHAAADDLDHAVWWEYDATRDIGSAALQKPWKFWVPSPRFNLPDEPGTDDQTLEIDALLARTTVKLTIPDSVTAQPPVTVTIERPFGKYTATYSSDAHTLLIDRRLQLRQSQLRPDRFAEYTSFTKTVEADYVQTFALGGLPGAGQGQQTAEQLATTGAQKLDARQNTEAIDLLRRAVALEPRHKFAWNNLGRALAAAGKPNEAIEAYRTAIDVNPYDEYAYNNLGMALQSVGHLDEAENAFRRQLTITPLDKFAHGNLGFLLIRRDRLAEGEAELATAARISPENRVLLAELGHVRLRLGRPGDALATFEQALNETPPAPMLLNNVAYWLAEADTELDRARGYAMKAVEAVEAQLQQDAPAAIRNDTLRAVASLTHYWDTLGWIDYHRKEFAVARAYLEPAWQLSQDPVIGEHLAVVLGALGESARAAQVRSMLGAVSGTEAVNSGSGPKPLKVTVEVPAGEALMRARTIPVTRRGGGPAYTGEFWVLHGRDGRIGSVRPVRSDPSGTAAAVLLEGIQLPFLAPTERPLLVLRRGVLDCRPKAEKCFFVLLRPTDVPPVD
jgi:Flp pilus assembly protein TadD